MTDSEFALLGLVVELGPGSGYRLGRVIQDRGMASWAGLSTTSMYNGLRKLRAGRLVEAKHDAKKSGKGPAGMLFAASPRARTALRHRVCDALAHAPGQSVAFRVALACSGQLSARTAAKQLNLRAQHLRQRIADVEKARSSQPSAATTPLAARLVFEYVLAGMRHELEQADQLAALLVKP